MTELSMYRGDDRTLTITASESLAGVEDIRFTAKVARADDEAVIAKSITDGIEIGDPDTTATVTIDAADTEDLGPVNLRWDIEITDALGKVRTVAVGRLLILPDVTRQAAS